MVTVYTLTAVRYDANSILQTNTSRGISTRYVAIAPSDNYLSRDALVAKTVVYE